MTFGYPRTTTSPPGSTTSATSSYSCGHSWRTRDEAENALFAYIDGWYNTERIQARLGWRSPDEYETAWHTRQAVQDDHPATPADRAESAPAR